ncbi:hypothetical protein XENOCAPTIV_006508, partial [Xenoophorus captivus]
TPRQLEVFDLPATTLNISNQSHAFAVVTFTPQAIRSYSAVFEATVKGPCRSKHTFMSQTLEFQLTGKGILPSVCVLGPAGGNSTGKPVIQFGRALKRFEVSFCSTKSETVETTMTVQVKDNQYSNTTIHVTGEAYQEIVSLDNISRSTQDGEDEVEGMKKGGD